MNIKEHLSKRNSKEKKTTVIVKQINKKYDLFIFVLFSGHPRSTGHPSSPNWTLDFEPAFSPRVSFPLSPRSIFQTSQRFLLLNHVTSGSHEPAILFSNWSAVSPTGNDMTSSSGHVIALDQSGARKSAILFSYWSAVSPTGNDMTSSSGHVIALDQSGASIFSIRAHSTTQVNTADR